MSDLSIVSKIMFILGFVTVLAVLMYGSNGPSLIPSPNPPVFDNPFEHGSIFSFGLDNPGPGFNTTTYLLNVNGNASGCSRASFWNCVIDPNGPDKNLTEIQINDGFNLALNLTGWPSAGKVRYGVLTMDCHANITGGTAIYAILHSWISSGGGVGTFYLDNQGENTYCRDISQGYKSVVSHLQISALVGSPTDLNVNPFPPNLQINIVCTDCWISTVSFTAFVSDPSFCAGTDFFSSIGCSFSQFIQNVGNWVQFIGNGISYVFSWIGVVGTIFANFFLTIRWLYFIPGMPSVIQLFVSSYLTTLFAALILSFVKILRGSQ